MSIDPKAVATYVTDNPVAAALGLLIALIVLAIVWRAGRGLTHALQRGLADKYPEDVITFVYSAMATAVSAEGMLKFFDHHLDMPSWMQALTFCMFELGMLGCALRARRKIRDSEIGAAGIDGKLVWVMAAVSGLLASTAASGWGILARIIIPLFAAGGWELLLAYERRRAGRSHIHWRVSFERVAVRLGLAEATGRTAGEVDTHRRITRVALAANRLRTLRSVGARDRRLMRAERRLNGAMRAAVEYADLATNEERQQELMAQLTVLNNASSLAEVSTVAPWDRPDPVVAVFEDARLRFAPLIAGRPADGIGELPALGTAVGTETGTETGTGNRVEDADGTGTEDAPSTGTRTGTEDGSDTGTGSVVDTGSGTARQSGTRRPRKTGTGTGTKRGGKNRAAVDRADLLERAQELNADHMREHGRPISGDKLVAALHVSKSTALELLREIKRPRAVRSNDGVA